MNMSEFYSEFYFVIKRIVLPGKFPSMLIAFRKVLNTVILSSGIVITRNACASQNGGDSFEFPYGNRCSKREVSCFSATSSSLFRGCGRCLFPFEIDKRH